MPSVIKGADSFNSQPYANFQVGVPFQLWDHFASVLLPDNSGDVKFIKLTAGLTGVGEFNEGLLINEVISGTAPLLEADAEITVGPLAGLRVPLLNSEERVLRGGPSGRLQDDQMQRIIGEIEANHTGFSAATGAFRTYNTGSYSPSGANTGTAWRGFNFNSANSPDARTSETTDGETRAKNVGISYYMRVV